ncbi:MAG: hypothetical protein IJ197_09265 [Bacteroidaceae bacterium]|nr:hypothetical protein [Bacteroidaceae bacterium]
MHKPLCDGHCLGRFWQIGPQQTLYLPGCWLRKGENEVFVMDILGPSSPTMSGLAEPIIDRLRRDLLPRDAVQSALSLGLSKKGDAALPSSVGNDAAPGAK